MVALAPTLLVAQEPLLWGSKRRKDDTHAAEDRKVIPAISQIAHTDDGIPILSVLAE
jgi:hypothetical protein